MKNRDQIRARNALAALPSIERGNRGGDALTGFPALIVGNGLLSTLAYSMAERPGHLTICDAIAAHLSDPDIGLVKQASANGLAKELTEENSRLLRLCTAEALAYLNFLRRFVKANGEVK